MGSIGTAVVGVLSVLAVVEAASIKSRCWTSGNGKPAQWFNENEVITRGKFYYECRGGQLEPLGCFSNEEKKVPVGGTFKQDGYQMICRLDRDGYLEFSYAGCVADDGVVHQKGDTWTDAKNQYYWRCRDDGGVVKMVIEGCIAHDKARRVPLGETDDYQGYTYKCQQKSDGVIQMCSIGCIHNGVHYAVGDRYRDGDYLYYCKIQGGKCSKQCIGCVANGKDLYDGQRYSRNGTTYQCEIRPTEHKHRAVGCAIQENGRDVNKVIGCRWYEQNGVSKVEKTCERTGSNKADVITVGCIYNYQGFDRIFLEPGKYTLWNLPRQKKVVGLACERTANGALLKTFNVDQLAENTNGLKYELPRGK